MLRRFVKERTSVFDEPIDRILGEMQGSDVDSEEYPKMLEHLSKLNEMKSEERRRRISPDTMLMVAGNLLGILIIVGYEQKHVVTSKALPFIQRTKHS